jgi:hypothetical protein
MEPQNPFLMIVHSSDPTITLTLQWMSTVLTQVFRHQHLLGELSIWNLSSIILDISDALHVPTACVNLISCSALDQKGVTTVTHNGKIELSKNGQVIAQSSLWKGLYRLNLTPIQQNTPTNITPRSLLSRIEPTPLIQRLSSSPMSTALQAMNTASDKVDFYTAWWVI